MQCEQTDPEACSLLGLFSLRSYMFSDINIYSFCLLVIHLSCYI